MAENFPKMEKRRDIQAQEGQRDPSKMNPPERNIIIKISKIKDGRENLKSTKRKQTAMYNRITVRLLPDFSAET